jgi:hypothetical protein
VQVHAGTFQAIKLSQITGLYGQFVGVCLATSRIKNSNNGFMLHLFTSIGTLVAIISLTSTMAQFHINCVKPLQDDVTDASIGSVNACTHICMYVVITHTLHARRCYTIKHAHTWTLPFFFSHSALYIMYLFTYLLE